MEGEDDTKDEEECSPHTLSVVPSGESPFSIRRSRKLVDTSYPQGLTCG